MAENSKIGWTDHTFNPWIGCTKVSPACRVCYAEELMDKRYGKVEWGPEGERIRTSPANWNAVRRLNKKAAGGRKQLAFCGSLCDVGEDRPELVPHRADLCKLILACDNLYFLLLSKRPENYVRLFPEEVLKRCWVGTTAENQEWYDLRVKALVQVPALLRFVSLEPLLGDIDLARPFEPTSDDWEEFHRLTEGREGWDEPEELVEECEAECDWINFGNDLVTNPVWSEWNDDRQRFARRLAFQRQIHWLIVGGESGNDRRALDLDEVDSIVAQAELNDTPLFIKQDSGPYPGAQGRLTDAQWNTKQWPAEAYSIHAEVARG